MYRLMFRRAIASHSRDVYCELFKDKVVYSIPMFFGLESRLGSRLEVEVSLQPHAIEKKFTHADLKHPLQLRSSAQKDTESFTTRVSVEELR